MNTKSMDLLTKINTFCTRSDKSKKATIVVNKSKKVLIQVIIFVKTLSQYIREYTNKTKLKIYVYFITRKLINGK